MQELLINSLERAASYFRSQEINIEKLPSFIYVDQYSPVSKQIIAQAKGELKQIRAINEDFSRGSLWKNLPIWYSQLGLKVSSDAVGQYANNYLRRLRKVTGLTDEDIASIESYGKEIIFFKPVMDLLEKNPKNGSNLLDSIVAHEFWHVIEMRSGLLNSTIVEGTAEYARIEFEKFARINEPAKYALQDYSDENPGITVIIKLMGEQVYSKGLEIVSKNVSSLSEVLVLDLRQRMQKEFQDYIEGWIAERTEKNDVPYEQRGAITRLLWPEFDALDYGLTTLNLFTMLNAAGLDRMAKELQHQDCTKLLEEYRKSGYGPKQSISPKQTL